MPVGGHVWTAFLRWRTAVILCFVLIIGGMFVWRVAYFTHLIKTGEISTTDFNFNDRLTPTKNQLFSTLPAGSVYDVVSQDDPNLGSDQPLLTIVEFADFGCPYSQEVSLSVRSLALAYGDRVRFIYRDFPVAELHPDAMKAAEASECAADQGKFWEYHDKLYQNQSDVSPDRFHTYAQALNLDVNRFDACLAQGVHQKEVQADYEDGVAAGVYGTPTFFFNGVEIPGAIPPDTFRQLIERFLASAQKK